MPERAHTHTHTLIFIHALGLICIECNIHSIDLLTQMHSHSQTHTHKYNFPLHSYTDSHTHTHNCPPLLTCFFTPCSFGDVNASRHVQCALTAEGGEGVCVRLCVFEHVRMSVCVRLCVLTSLKNQLTAHSSRHPPPPNEEVN